MYETEPAEDGIIITDKMPELIGETHVKLQLLRQQTEEAERELRQMIARFQEMCPHEETVVVVEWDFDYQALASSFARGAEVYRGKRCLACGKFFPRKEGAPDEVCHKCGADMQPDGWRRDRGYHLVISKCPQCGHIYEKY